MTRNFLRTPAAAVALALACCAAASPAAAQQAASPAEMHEITCYLVTVEEIRTAMEAGSAPLLVVSGREIGALRMPSAPCPARPRLPRGLTEFRIIAPHAAPQFYGERGRNGAVVVDLPPAPPR